MFTLREQPAHFYASARLLRKILKELLSNISPRQSGLVIAGNRSLYPTGKQRHRLYCLRDGFLRCKREQRLLFFIEPGDLIAFNFYPESVHIYADSPVIVDEYLEKDLLTAVRREVLLFDLWMRCLSLQMGLVTTLVGGEDETTVESTESDDNSLDEFLQPDLCIQDTATGEALTRELFRHLSRAMDGSEPPHSDPEILLSVPRRQLLALFRRYPHQALRLLENLRQELPPRPLR